MDFSIAGTRAARQPPKKSDGDRRDCGFVSASLPANARKNALPAPV